MNCTTATLAVPTLRKTLLAGLVAAAMPFAHAQTNTTAEGVDDDKLKTMHETGEVLEGIDADTASSQDTENANDPMKPGQSDVAAGNKDSAVPESGQDTDMAAGTVEQPAAKGDAELAAGDDSTIEEEVKDMVVGEGEPVEGQILLQSENTILADDLIGVSVYSQDDERVGEINDLIVSFDGKVEGAIIGVGGFLGIGEKDVAIEMAALELIPTDDDSIRLYVSTTRDEMEEAPGFASKWEQQAAADTMTRREEVQPEAPGVVAPLASDPAMGSGNPVTVQ